MRRGNDGRMERRKVRSARRRVAEVAALLSVLPSFRLSAQCPDGSPPPCRAPARVAPAPNSVAVLYFDNLSSDSSYAYLADGLTEELIAKLSEVPRLLVRSSFSVRRYKGTPGAEPAAVGRTLGVAFLVSGSVRPGRDRVRVTVEVVRAQSGARVWGRVLDRPSDDPLAVTAEIAGDVAAGMIGQLVPAERAALAARPTRNARAYDHVLRGNYYLAQRSARSVLRAIQEYREAVRLDPTFGAAYARLALAYAGARSNVLDVGVPPDSLEARARAALDRARALDSLNTDALLAAFVLGGELRSAAWDRAIARDSDNAELQHLYGIHLAAAGDRARAAAALRRAIAIDPDRPITLGWLSLLAVADGRFAEARRWADSALALNPSFPGYAHRALIDLQLGDTARARADVAAGLRASAGRGVGEASLALVAVATGDSAAGRARLHQLLGPDLSGSLLNDEARAYAVAALGLLGDTLAALDLLERPQPDRYVALLAPLSVFDPLRFQPRFQRLLEEPRPR